jgi:uncharacterized protein
MSAATTDPARSTGFRAALIALASGIIFAAGLVLGGMTDPRKVQGFLDVGGVFAGRWDPSLAFVMCGALLVSFIAFASIKNRAAPWAAAKFEIPTRKEIDVRLIAGAAIFGTGWAIAGFCPGPAFASLLMGGTDVLWFVGAMLAGMFVARKWFAA